MSNGWSSPPEGSYEGRGMSVSLDDRDCSTSRKCSGDRYTCHSHDKLHTKENSSQFYVDGLHPYLKTLFV